MLIIQGVGGGRNGWTAFLFSLNKLNEKKQITVKKKNPQQSEQMWEEIVRSLIYEFVRINDRSSYVSVKHREYWEPRSDSHLENPRAWDRLANRFDSKVNKWELVCVPEPV